MIHNYSSIEQVTHLVTKSAGRLEELLADILKVHGGHDCLPDDVDIFDIHNFNGFSGYNYWVEGNLVGQLHMATLQASGFVVYKRTYDGDLINEVYDYYNQTGDYVYSSAQLDGQTIPYQSINMDPTSPLSNHLYNILYAEYAQVATSIPRTSLLLQIEKTLRKVYSTPNIPLSAKAKAKDLALRNIFNEIINTEADPVLRWDERQQIYKNLKGIRKKIIQTKNRVHRFNSLRYNLNILKLDLQTRLTLLRKRPMDNIKGFIYQYTIGNLLWFLQTVKDNLGYSIALAIYGPFTFYFITQPMNPHAMWAVGKVRNAYIQTSKNIDSIINGSKDKIIVKKKTLDTVVESGDNSSKVSEDKVTHQQASINKKSAVNLIKTKAPKVDWQTRMSDFKAMQIALEANMVFAERMGRIEQMENQFSFPLTAEAAWNEIQRYTDKITADLNYFKNLDGRYKKFLNDEIERATKAKVYIWKKMAQFFLDHPYIVVDQEDKQTQRDYYVGRSFIFMQNMTQDLRKLDPQIIPTTHEQVQKLATFYQQNRVEGSGVMENLQKNSKLFATGDHFSSDKLRQYMKRHWEILFIQQNKKQEASSFGLQAYTWSIKNAIWTLQSIYSLKRDDLMSLSYKFNLDNETKLDIKSDAIIDLQYENLFHMLNIEYVSLKKEFSNNLRGDDESTQREAIIEDIKEFLIDRDKLFHAVLKVAIQDNSQSKRI